MRGEDEKSSDGRRLSSFTLLCVWKKKSDVEAELDDVTVFDGVFLAFDAELPGVTAGGLGTEVDEIIIVNDLSSDEATFEIVVDGGSGARSLISRLDGPGAGLLFTRGEVCAET